MSEQVRSKTRQRDMARRDAEAKMLEAYRVPVVATLVFMLLMLSIYAIGQQVTAYYAANGLHF